MFKKNLFNFILVVVAILPFVGSEVLAATPHLEKDQLARVHWNININMGGFYQPCYCPYYCYPYPPYAYYPYPPSCYWLW